MSRVTFETSKSRLNNLSTDLIEHSIETSIFDLQEEKNEELRLNKQISQLKHQLFEASNKKALSFELEGLKKAQSSALKQVEASFKQLNAIQSENKLLKDKIEDLRLESNKCKRIIGGLEQDLAQSSNLARARSQSKLKEIHTEEQTKSKIYQALNKSTTEKANFSSKISNLSTMIKKNLEEQSISMRSHTDSMQQQLSRPLTAIDLENVLSHINSCKSLHLKSLNKALKSHISKQTPIMESFIIMQNVSGLNSFQEIAQSFINTEIRNKEVQTYLLNLSADIQSLHFTNRNIMAQLNPNEEKDTKFLKKCTQMKNNIAEELKTVQRGLDLYNAKSEIITRSLQGIDDILNVSDI